MTYSGNYQAPPPNKLTPGFPGNYPDGPPPIYVPPGPNPEPSPDDTFYLFKRAEDGRPDVSMFSYWNKPLIREAMLILEDHFEMNENNPNNPMVCTEYYEKDLGNAIANASTLSFNSSSQEWINAFRYKLEVNVNKINVFTQDEWVAIFTHELLHALGFYWWKFQQFQDIMGYPVVTNASPGLSKEQFPLAYEAYQERFANATATPLFEAPGMPGSNLSHYPYPSNSAVIDGVANPGFNSLMNPGTQPGQAQSGIDNEIRGTIAAYGYKLKTPQLRSTRTLKLPANFVCGHDHYEEKSNHRFRLL